MVGKTNNGQMPPPSLHHPAMAHLLPPWHLGPSPTSTTWDFTRPLVMGILNATPDSFSDGGLHHSPQAARTHALDMAVQGADLIDLGGASSRPGAVPIPPEIELARLMPVLQTLVEARQAGQLPLPFSIDTTQATVAKSALAAGADVLNDVSGLANLEMAHLAATFGVVLVVMHPGWGGEGTHKGLPGAMPSPTGLMDALGDFFTQRLAQARSAGVTRVILDPGYGFNKPLEHNLVLLRELARLAPLGCPLLIGASRKGSLGTLVGEPVPSERLGASLAAALFAAQQGAHLLRVHDVKATVQALKVWRTLEA